jgi:hypothetical protein
VGLAGSLDARWEPDGTPLALGTLDGFRREVARRRRYLPKMAKLLLLSVVIMMVAIPVLAARDRSPRRGLQKTILLVIAFNIFYVFVHRFIYPHVVS